MSETAGISGPRPSSGLLASYAPGPGFFDEALTTSGEIRPHYRDLLDALGGLDPAEWKRRRETGRRLVHEQGITYNVYGDPRGMERPWQLDPIPLLIGAAEWRSLEAALIQRATLINRVLADCYGPQELIRSNFLPPALVFAQPDFLRPCYGVRPANESFLHFYAADVARSPDGKWWVVSDRTQIPTGAGYALANRLVTSRLLPESFREGNVHRLAGFFREVQASLASLARRRTDDPRVVLLTPGPYNETYFEQSYLARYLGYMLVQGQDLTVRDDRVFLKTLSGLEPVDVILRRVDDEFCDPLELRNDSMLGVPGLVEALRAGNVSVANALGSSLLQSPAFLAFLPGLCRHLLGEDLKIPSIPTWWCGQESAGKYVSEHLETLFVKPAFRTLIRGMEPGKRLSAVERETLARRIAFQPHLFVGQEWVELSTAPAWSESGLEPRPVAMRVYAVASRGTYKVMPGGLTRVAAETGAPSVSMQRGGTSKDTWVLSEEPVEEITLLESGAQTIELRRVGNNLPSRLADNFFWLGRYAERTDSTARLLRSALSRFSPESNGSTSSLLTPLLETLRVQRQLPGTTPIAELRRNPEALEADLLAVIFDPERPSSLRQLADNLLRLATMVGDRTSNDLWRVISRLNDRLTPPAGSPILFAGDAVGTLNEALLSIAAFHGLARENMTRAQGWRFLDMGLRVERTIYLADFLECALRSPEADTPSLLEAVLEVADSSITYRSRYNVLPNMAAVYDLVLLDENNPRSLLFQLNQLTKHFERLPREKESALPSAMQRILFECVARLRVVDPRGIAPVRGNWTESAVAQAIQQTARDMPRLSDALAASYFAHSQIARAGGSEVK